MTAIADPWVARHLRRQARNRTRRAAGQHRAPLLAYVLRSNILTIVTAPVIYSSSVPFVVLDVWVSGYQLKQ